MEGASFQELAGWAISLASLAVMVVGYGTGPAGWMGIVAYYGGALTTFAGMTLSTYATVSRLQLSNVAAAYLENARNINLYCNYENIQFNLVDGY